MGSEVQRFMVLGSKVHGSGFRGSWFRVQRFMGSGFKGSRFTVHWFISFQQRFFCDQNDCRISQRIDDSSTLEPLNL